MRSDNLEAIKSACLENIVTLPGGGKAPRLGQGTWHMGDKPELRKQEISSLRTGIDLGMTLIDTAEMYGGGAAETLTGEAIRGFNRESLFIVSKVYPQNAGRSRIFKSCENSLKRLGLDSLDLYLLHWRGSVPLSETVECFEKLAQMGKIKRWGVSNFDLDDMIELWNTPGGQKCASNQVLYHLGSRGVEFDLLPFMREKGVPLMAYCPLAQAGVLSRGLLSHPVLTAVARSRGASCAQVLLAFLLKNESVIAIPKAKTPDHVLENAGSSLIKLNDDEIAKLNEAFPAPTKKVPLDIN